MCVRNRKSSVYLAILEIVPISRSCKPSQDAELVSSILTLNRKLLEKDCEWALACLFAVGNGISSDRRGASNTGSGTAQTHLVQHVDYLSSLE